SSEGRNNRETKSGIARKMAAGLEKKVVRKAKNLDWQIFPQPVKPRPTKISARTPALLSSTGY
ncbi:MAG: hypothetical protein WCA19_01070, partial [Candidatus Acidiferrales bacterium]